LGYLKSCWRETISGGTVTVGPEQSEVAGGEMARAKGACEGGKMMLSAELAGKSGAMGFRQAPKPQAVAAAPHPEFTLYGLSPVFEVRPPGKLVVERLDQPGERHEIAVTEQALVRGAFLDFAKSGVALAPGGVYRAKLADREIVFKIDPDAQPGDAPLVGRLARLQARPSSPPRTIRASRRLGDAGFVLAIAIFSSALILAPPLDRLRGLSIDILTMLRWRVFGSMHKPEQSPTIVVALDEETYRTPPFAGTPAITWTSEIGQVLTAVLAGGAKVVGFDIVF